MPDPMMQQPTHDQLFFRIRLLLEEGRSEQAQSELEAMQTYDEKQEREKAYFLGWCYVLNKRWDDAMQVLLPFSHYEAEQDEKAERIERERKARSLLRLGYAAINLNHFEDAERHLRACLKVLRHKQLQGPEFQLLRIQANYSLGMSFCMRGLYAAALQQYEEALRLFLYVDNDEELANIYYGLCDIYRKSGRFVEAQQAGEQALQLYIRSNNLSLEGRIRNLLGHIAFQRDDYKGAGDYFTEALAIAASLKSGQMVMVNCEALANLRAAECRFDQARRYCQLAQEMSRETQNSFLRGHAYLMAGKVSRAEAQQAKGELQQTFLEEATKQFEIAHAHFSLTEAYEERAETLVLWAQTCEALGRSQESLHLWRSVYQTQARAKGLAEDHG
jgi:tetratricopeptide (TPR) repeat protein